MSTPLPGSRRPPAGTQSVDAEALLADFDEAPLEVKINMLSTLERSLRESFDAPEQS